MRQPPRRVILPSGELKRFRLPDALGEDAVGVPGDKTRATSLAALITAPLRGPRRAVGAAWFGMVFGCWMIVHSPPNLERFWSAPLTGEIDWQANVGVARAAIEMPTPPALGGSGVASTTRTRSGVGEGATARTPVRVAVEAPAASSEPPVLARSSLPPVRFQGTSVHAGGLGVGTNGVNNSVSDNVAPTVDAVAHDVEAKRPSNADVRAPAAKSVGAALPDLLSGLSSDLNTEAWVAQKEVAAGDPFEEDFTRSIALKGDPSTNDAPVKLRRADIAGTRRSATPSHVPSDPSKTAAAQPAVSHGGSGCQAAFDASEQQMDVTKRAAADVSAAQYAAAVRRVDALRCQPNAATQVNICAAVADGRAIGVTVQTTPGDAALGRCLVAQVQRLSFPRGGGVDLVRTTLSIE